MAAERPRGRKLTELMTYHVFGNIYWYMLTSVMNCECVTNEIREYC